jgi:hypothetical protein
MQDIATRKLFAGVELATCETGIHGQFEVAVWNHIAADGSTWQSVTGRGCGHCAAIGQALYAGTRARLAVEAELAAAPATVPAAWETALLAATR